MQGRMAVGYYYVELDMSGLANEWQEGLRLGSTNRLNHADVGCARKSMRYL
jgi:hypothetical protein